MVEPPRNDIVPLLRACVTLQRLGPRPADTQSEGPTREQ
jgi:hypothetical protein